MSEYLNGFRFEPRDLPPPLTLNEVNAFVEKLKRRIVCAPDALERIDRLVRDEGYGAVFRVIPCVWLEPGQVIVMQSEADDEADLRRAVERTKAEITGGWRRQAEECAQRLRYELELRQNWAGSSVGRPWTHIVTGL